MRALFVGVVALTLSLSTAGCASSSGDPAAGFMNSSVESAFIPLSGMKHLIISSHGAAVVLAPGIAVTNAHNENIVDSGAILGKSQQYDLLFFRTDHGAPIQTAAPAVGEDVVAYGEGDNGDLRISYGVVRKLKAPVKPVCPVCAVQVAFTFEGNAGPGFSGGPVLDAKDGHLVGITFGYLDDADGKRVMYAYDMARVKAEFSSLQPQTASLAK